MKKWANVISVLLFLLMSLSYLPTEVGFADDEVAPIAEAGPNQTILEGEIAKFDGSLSVGSVVGRVFSENLKVSMYHPLSVSAKREPQLRIDRTGTIHTIWTESVQRFLDAVLYYSKSVDGGLSFGPNVQIMNVTKIISGGTTLNPRFDLDDNGTIHVVWTSLDVDGYRPAIYYSKSTNGGVSFDVPHIVLLQNVSSGLSVDREGTIHLLAHGVEFDLYHLTSEDSGQSFGKATRVNDPDVLDTSHFDNDLSRMVIDGFGNIHVAWPGVRIGEDTETDVFYSKSEDGGLSFSANFKVHGETGKMVDGFGSFDVDSHGNPHVVWLERSYNEVTQRLMYAKSGDGGTSFEERILVRSDEHPGIGAGLVVDPSIAMGLDDLPRIAWTESFLSVKDGNVWYSEFEQARHNFSHRILVTDDDRNNTRQGPPTLDVDEYGHSHVIWMDDREGEYEIYYSRTVPGRASIESYEWDMNSHFDSDADGNSSNDVDASGSKPNFPFGDDGSYMVTLKVTDDMGATAYDTATVTVLNVDPTISSVSHEMENVTASVLFRIAGEKWHNVEIHLFEDDAEVGCANITRYPGSPNEQVVLLADISASFSKKYSAIAHYTPEDDPLNGQLWGATPAWLILAFDDEERRIHHAFNVRHEDSWVWDIGDLNQYFPLAVILEATAYDPGSDDLRFFWDFGDGGSQDNIYFNDGANPDPPLSPSVNPVTLKDKAKHTYSLAGTYAIVLKVMDDDSGWSTTQIMISI